MATRGRERYGVAGSVTHRPPAVPIAVSGSLRPGEDVAFGRLHFRVFALPAHSPYAVGLLLTVGGQLRAVFCGDLYRDPGVLVNLYDLERGYGVDALPEVPGMLRRLAALGCPMVCPATGPAMADGDRRALALATRIDAWLAALTWESGRFRGVDNLVPSDPERHPRIGRWCRRAPGIYQMDQYGNAILLIDGRGRGLMVDPGPCGYGVPDRAGAFHDDLARFERDCGLRTIDLALITHPHGDHYDMVPELRRRYSACRVGAWGAVAQVIENPSAWPYAALLPWYGLGLDRIPVDLVLRRDTPFDWHGTAIASAWLPGHCRLHAGYFCRFNGLNLAFTGDAIQERGRAATWSFIWSNDPPPTDELGLVAAYRTAARFPTDLNLGGHSSWFTGCAELYAESVARMEHALPFLAAVVPDGDLLCAGHRPWHPDADRNYG